MLQSENEEYQEAAILVLGCIADEDCAYDVIESHLDHLVPFLISKLDSQSNELLSTTCWTLSKFSDWISQTEEN